MNLNDYIALSSKHPNRAVLQGLGASEELIEYLMETPENTNLNVVGSLSENEETEEIILLDWTSFKAYDNGDSSDQFYANLTTDNVNFDTTLVQEGETIKIIIKNSTNTLENVISNVIILTDNGYYYYEEPFGTSFQFSYANDKIIVWCCDGVPFIGAADEWTAPTNWQDLQIKIIKINN